MVDGDWTMVDENFSTLSLTQSELEHISMELASKGPHKSQVQLRWVSQHFVCLLLGPRLWHMKVPRLGVESELQLLAYTTVTATLDPNRIYDLCRNLQQRWILKPLSEARDQPCILMDTRSGPSPAEPQRELLSFSTFWKHRMPTQNIWADRA